MIINQMMVGVASHMQPGQSRSSIQVYSSSPTCQRGTRSNRKERKEKEEEEKPPLVIIPYVAGLSEDIRCVCRKFGVKVTFRTEMTLKSQLTEVKVRLLHALC